MRTKNVKELMEMIFYTSLHIDELQTQDKLIEGTEGVGFVDRHFRAMITRASKANLRLLEEVNKTYPSVYIKTDPRVLEDRISKLLQSLYYEMGKKGGEIKENEKTIDFDAVKTGLPKPFRIFLSGIIVSTNLFDKKYKNLMDENIKKCWEKYTDRVDTIVNKLVDENIIWYEELV